MQYNSLKCKRESAFSPNPKKKQIFLPPKQPIRASVSRRSSRKPLSRLCWIGTTSRGLLLIELRNPLCVSGASLTSVPDGAGRLPFTFLAQSDRPGDVNLPARLYWWKEETHDAA